MASIASISPAAFDDGKPVTLTGSGFGASQGSVLIGGVAQNVNTWSDTSITFNTVRGLQSLGACRVDVVAESSSGYTPTVIVTNQTELNTELAKSAAALEGQVIGVQYNATPYVITRDGTPNLKDKNFGTGGLVICGYGATKPRFSSLDFQGTKNLTVHGIEVYNEINGNLITIRSGVENFTLSTCEVHSDYYDPMGNYGAYEPSTTQAKGIRTVSAGAGAAINNIYINDCEFYDLLEVLGTSQTISGDFHFIGNNCHTFYTGGLVFGAGLGSGTTKINWNTFYEAYGKSSDANIGLGTPPHVDFIQPRAVQRDWIMEIIGNVMFQGNSRNQTTQCIFLDDQHVTGDETHFYTATIKGNVCITNSLHAISVLQAKDCIVTGNTVIHADNTATIGSKINIGTGTSSYPNGDGGGNVAKNNVAYSVAAGTETNNNEYGAYTTAVLTDRFDGPSFTGLNSRAAVLAALSMKVSGPLDQTVNIGAVGSGYVDYMARTINGAME